ncbi:histone H1-like [Durio zibethinus]|uniref:Histone H1-like n=1 Tax=Durio zibethinus TaxID=66656 RepID=A0A6P5WW31_DURZI|nr:histone H1-like [Durio zibethinus]
MAYATGSAVASVAKKKKTAGAKKPKSVSSHPPFIDMISDAIVTLKERTGSSQYAITKFIEEKYKQLPSNFRKLLLVQMRKFVASGKLVKVKASFKLPPASTVAKKPAPAKPKIAKTVAKPKVKSKVTTPVKAKAKVAVKAKATSKAKAKPAAKPTKAAKTAKKSSPGKKVKAPAKKAVAKKPKRVKSPAKKSAPKKAKK